MTRIQRLDTVVLAGALFLLFVAGISWFQGAASLSFVGIPLFALGLCFLSAMLLASLNFASRDTKIIIVIVFVSALLGTYGAEIYVAGQIHHLKVAQPVMARAVAAQMAQQDDPTPQEPWRSAITGRQEAATLDSIIKTANGNPVDTRLRSRSSTNSLRKAFSGSCRWVHIRSSSPRRAWCRRSRARPIATRWPAMKAANGYR